MKKEAEENTLDKEKLEKASELLYRKNFAETLEILPSILQDLNYEEKREVMGDLLCEEWYLITDHEYILNLLDIFAASLK